MRICLISSSREILGGLAVQAQQLVDGFRTDPAVEVRFIPTNPVLPRPFRFAVRVPLLRTTLVSIAYRAALRRTVPRCDVVHIFSAAHRSFFISTIPAIRAARRAGRPSILNYHSGEAASHLEAGGRRLQRWLASADRIVVPSHFLQEVFEARGHTVDLVPNAVDLDRFRYRERRPLQPLLLSTRNLQPIYRVDRVIRAFSRVRAVWPEARLVVAGSGSEERRLRRLADELVPGVVTFTGEIPHPAIHRLYDEAHLLLNAAAVDNLPLTILEAFSAGTLVVSDRAGEVGRLIRHGENGFLVDSSDPEAFAAPVLRMLDGSVQAAGIACQARTDAEAYSWERVGPQWRALYSEIC